MTRLIAAAVVCGVVAAAVVGARVIIDHNGEPGAAAFFAVPSARACPAAALDLSLTSAVFAASVHGSGPASGGKFLVATLRAVNHASQPHPDLTRDLRLTDINGHVYKVEGAPPANWAPLAATATAEGDAAFGIPLELAAAKLIFDDGCTHDEWVVP